MKLTVIGKYGPYAKPNGGATSCYLVQSEGTNVVMDMGSGSLSRLLSKVSAENIDAIILTHLHFDHTSDLLTFRYLAELVPKKFTIYAPRAFGKWYDVLLDSPDFRVINYDENSSFDVGNFKVTFFKTKHTVLSYGIKLFDGKTLAYTGDTLFYDELYDDLRDTDFVIADCSNRIGFTGPHMTVADAVKINNKITAKLLCSHANVNYSPVEDLKGTDIEFAEEMKEYYVE